MKKLLKICHFILSVFTNSNIEESDLICTEEVFKFSVREAIKNKNPIGETYNLLLFFPETESANITILLVSDKSNLEKEVLLTSMFLGCESFNINL